MHVERVIDHVCELGEGPLWDARKGAIIWVDILKGEIHEYQEDTKEHRTIAVKDLIGSVALCANGHFLVALKTGLALVHRKTGAVKVLVHPEMHLPQNRFNDGKCDPAGRFWVGTMALSEEPGAGSLYMIDTDLSYSKKVEAVSISNGMAWSRDQKIFYFIDTPTRKVVAYDFDLASAEISNKRVVLRIVEEEGFPDGMTMDEEGCLWIAHWDGWRLSRWDPVLGKKLEQIPLPVARVTSCAFGGNKLQDLYISSAKTGLSEEQLKQQPLAGSLFVIRNCGYRGMESFEFGLNDKGLNPQ